MNKIFLASLSLIFTLSALSQKLVATSEEFPGTPFARKYPNASRNKNQYFEKNIVYGNDEAVMVMSVNKLNDEAIVKINAAMKTVWQTAITDKVISISRLKNNILVVSTPEWKKDENNFIKKINAVLIDPVTGGVVMEKMIFESTADVFVEPDIMADEKNNFQALLIRYTAQNKERVTPKTYSQRTSTAALHVITLDEKLTAAVRVLTTDLKDRNYLGSVMSKNGDLFITGCSKEFFFAEKYPVNSTKLSVTLKSNYEAHKEATIAGHISLNGNGDMLIAAFSYPNKAWDKVILTMLFNFAEGKTYRDEEVFTKKHSKEIKIEDAGGMEVSSARIANDKIIVCKEVQELIFPRSSNSNNFSYRSLTILITVYDKHFNLLKNLIFYRYCVSQTAGQLYAGYAINNHLMYVLYSNIDGPAKFVTRLAKIDLDKLEVISETGIARDSVIARVVIEPSASLWLGKKLILPYVIDQFNSSKNTTVFQQIELE